MSDTNIIGTTSTVIPVAAPATGTNLGALLNLILTGSAQMALSLLSGNPALIVTYGTSLVGALLHILENHGLPISALDLETWKSDAAKRAAILGGLPSVK